MRIVAEKLYIAWHRHFRSFCVPWTSLSVGNRNKWIAVAIEASGKDEREKETAGLPSRKASK